MGGEDAAGKIPGDFEAEVKQALDNLGVVLKAAKMSAGDVVSVQVLPYRCRDLRADERRLQDIL
jgi:enamine deaminase RidA (YjgF/YER057c/UK114 family)